MKRMIRIGTRGSALALWQANETQRLLKLAGYDSEIVKIRTTGDKRQNVKLAFIGGKGVFIKELEEALMRSEIDIAVHSLKDVPSFIPPEFALAAFLERADPRDAWVHRSGTSIREMREGTRVGTSAPRRRAQLRALYPHFQVEEMRGNVDTRLEKVRSGVVDGAILAGAGLKRLGKEGDITSLFSFDEMTPAAGQGIVAIEAMTDEAREAVASINHKPSEQAALCERGVLQRFDDRLDCYSAVGVHAEIGKQITIRAFFGEIDGTRAIRVTRTGSDAQALIDEVYNALVDAGALDLLPKDPADKIAAGKNAGAPPEPGKVYLVGAGPGDPGLLTVKGADLIASADVVATDALVSPAVVARIPKNAEVIYVGKRSGAHSVPQDQTNRILVEKAKEGKRVVRLKGGDPFVFGRGGEEAEELAEAGIEFEVVPGVSSAIAGPAYAGIPITHRDHATAVMFVTGHESDDSTGIDWEPIAKFRGTIVFLMGIANLGNISRNLRQHGMPATREVAVISRGTTKKQRTVTGTLETIEEVARGIETPALIVVGSVVQLRKSINWYETKPLYGKRIVVTRAREQASDLKRMLEEEGAEVVEFPTIEIAPPASFDSLDHVIDGLDDYQWIVFTSANGVGSFFDRLRNRGKDSRALAGRMIAAVGDTTAAQLRARGIEPDLVPARFQSAALLPLLANDQKGIRTAVIRAAAGSDELIEGLRKRGGEVDLGVAYETRPVAGDTSQLEKIDFVTFTSGSTVDNFFEVAGDRLNGALRNAKIVSIGPVTSEAIRRHGNNVDIEAEAATVDSMRAAILRACRSATT